MTFVPLEVREKRQETPELAHLALAGAPTEFLSAFRVPGQYVPVKCGDLRPAFFALACGPGTGRVELLVKRGSPVANTMLAQKLGESLLLGPPSGKGFPIEQARGRDVFVIGVGSGVAPLRALMHTVLAERAAFGRVVFIHGARTTEDFAYRDEVDSWQDRDIEVIRVCSRPGAETAWSGPVGRVQDVLLARRTPVAAGTVAFVCGMASMVQDVKAAFAQLGLAAERVFQNV